MNEEAETFVHDPTPESSPAPHGWTHEVQRYRSGHAHHAASDPEEGNFADRTRLASPRVIGAASHIFILTRLQLLVAVVLGATLLDFAIEGSMREALRYAVIDRPEQFPAIIVGLLLACAALRFSAEAMIELVSPDLFDAPGNIGRLAHLLPRGLAVFIGFAAGYPLLKLAADPALEVLGTLDNRIFAAVFGAIFVAVGVLVGIVGKGPHRRGRVAITTSSSPLLRWTLVLLPLAAVVALAGTIWGIFSSEDPSHYLGIPHGALERYLGGDIAGGLTHAAIDALAIFLTAIVARLAFNVIVYLVAPNAMGSSGIAGAIAAWIPRLAATAVGFVLTVRLIALYTHIAPGKPALSDHESRWLLGIALAYSLIALLAALIDGSLSLVTDSSTIFQRTGSRWLMGAERMAALDGSWRRFFALLLVGALAIFFVFVDVSQVARAQAIGPIAIILLWGFSATALFFPFAYMSHATKMPLLLMLLIAGMAFAGFDINDNHALRGASADAPTVEVALAASAAAEKSYYGEVLNIGEWLKSRRDWDQYPQYPIFIVATEGGGIRAAYFTASVLAALQEKCPAFAQHVIAISSVSGGSVGAAVFAGEAAEQASNVPHVGCNLGAIEPGVIVERARKVLATDLLSPLLGATLFPDALQRILPLPIDEFDRARALEYALEDAWRKNEPQCRGCDPERMSTKVSALYPKGEVRTPVPHLFLNTTEAGSGLSKPFATWTVQPLAGKKGIRSLREEDALTTLKLVSLQDRMGSDEVPLSTAAMVSARFPYLTPAARLGDVGHYVDGGYFENSGTWLVSGIAQNLITQRLDFTSDDKKLEQAVKQSVIVAVIIRSAPCSPCTVQGTDAPGADLDATWNEMLSPVRALIYTRDKRAQYSINDLGAMTSLIQRLTLNAASTEPRGLRAQTTPAQNATPMASNCNSTICTVTVTFHNQSKAEVPLSWVLSSRARQAMDQAVDNILSENLQMPAPPIENAEDINRLDGSYRRIMCLLQNDSKSVACAPEKPAE